MPVKPISGTTGSTNNRQIQQAQQEGQQQQKQDLTSLDSNRQIRHKTETGRNMKQISGRKEKQQTTAQQKNVSLSCPVDLQSLDSTTGNRRQQIRQQIRQQQPRAWQYIVYR